MATMVGIFAGHFSSPEPESRSGVFLWHCELPGHMLLREQLMMPVCSLPNLLIDQIGMYMLLQLLS